MPYNGLRLLLQKLLVLNLQIYFCLIHQIKILLEGVIGLKLQ